jgi:predicted nucleotidyltransferase
VQLIIPPGTRVVSRGPIRIAETGLIHPSGAVAVVVHSPADAGDAYRVRFPDGSETNLRRPDFGILRSHRDTTAGEGVLLDIDWQQYIIYRCVVGSRAFGLDTELSDVDRRGIYLPPADLQWSLYGVPEQLENNETQEAYWELGKFVRLALKANPGILECLYTTEVEEATDLARELLGMRQIFLSKLVYQTFNGYVLSQFKKLEQDLRTHGAIKWKHAMHLIRLLLSGITIMREHRVPVRVVEHRDRLLAIKRGELPWEEVDAWRLQLHKSFDKAFSSTSLPDRPDFDRANAFVIRARRAMVGSDPP